MGPEGQKGEPGFIGDHGIPGGLGQKGEKGLPGAPGIRVSTLISLTHDLKKYIMLHKYKLYINIY